MQHRRAEVLADADALLQGHDGIPVAHALLLASTYQRVDGCRRETGRAIALRIYLEMQVGDGQVLLVLVLTVHVHYLADDAHRAPHVLGHLRSALHGDADDNVGPHLAGNVSRIVVFQAAIHEHHVAYSHRREGCRDSHRRTHGLCQPTAVEIYLRVVDNVRSHAGKRDGQVARKVKRVGVSRAELLE